MCKICGKIENDLCEKEIKNITNWLRCLARKEFTGVVFGSAYFGYDKDVLIKDDRWKQGKPRLCMIVFECNESRKNGKEPEAFGFAYDIDKNGQAKIIRKMNKETVIDWYCHC